MEKVKRKRIGPYVDSCCNLLKDAAAINIIGPFEGGRSNISDRVSTKLGRDMVRLTTDDILNLDETAHDKLRTIYVVQHPGLLVGKESAQKSLDDFIKKQAGRGNKFIFEHHESPLGMQYQSDLGRTFACLPGVDLFE